MKILCQQNSLESIRCLSTKFCKGIILYVYKWYISYYLIRTTFITDLHNDCHLLHDMISIVKAISLFIALHQSKTSQIN